MAFYGMNYIVLKSRKQTVDDTKRNDPKHNKVGSQPRYFSELLRPRRQKWEQG